MPKALIIVGTRPEAIKLIPLYMELKKTEKFEAILASTGQHREMLNQIFNYFGVNPDLKLDIMTHNQSLGALTSMLFAEVETLIDNVKPDLLFIQGDTTTAMVSAMVGFYHQIKVCHIEAGLRTFNKLSPFPEEVNRNVISMVGDYHFAPTQKAAAVLEKLGHKNVFVTGNTVIDSLIMCHEKVESNLAFYENKFSGILQRGRHVLVTGHRRENFGAGFKEICEALINIASHYSDTDFVYPVHLNPNVSSIVNRYLSGQENIHLIPPLDYDDLVFLMSRACLILTDSGGIQEEGPHFNVPVLVMRNDTEREEGLESGCAVIVGTDADNIVREVRNVLEDRDVYNAMAQSKNPFGDGSASAQIVAILESRFA